MCTFLEHSSTFVCALICFIEYKHFYALEKRKILERDSRSQSATETLQNALWKKTKSNEQTSRKKENRLISNMSAPTIIYRHQRVHNRHTPHWPEYTKTAPKITVHVAFTTIVNSITCSVKGRLSMTLTSNDFFKKQESRTPSEGKDWSCDEHSRQTLTEWFSSLFHTIHRMYHLVKSMANHKSHQRSMQLL